jgi:hypothetical protein
VGGGDGDLQRRAAGPAPQGGHEGHVAPGGASMSCGWDDGGGGGSAISKKTRLKLFQSHLESHQRAFMADYIIVSGSFFFIIIKKNHCMGHKWLQACARPSSQKTTKIAPYGLDTTVHGCPRGVSGWATRGR